VPVPPPAPIVRHAPAPTVRQAARETVRGFQEEGNAQGWAFWIAAAAAIAAAYFTWHWFGNLFVSIGAGVVAFCVGAWFGYKFAKLLTALLVLTVVVFGLLVFLGWQHQKKTEEEARKNAAFDPKSLTTTLLWMEVQGQKVTEVDGKKNEVLSKEAFEELGRTLARAEGAQVEWQATVASVNPDSVALNGPSIGSGHSLRFEVVAGTRDPQAAQQPQGLALPITPEQSRRLAAGQTITFTGRVQACRAERAAGGLAFTLIVSEARVVD
jgi:hypothetical protein